MLVSRAQPSPSTVLSPWTVLWTTDDLQWMTGGSTCGPRSDNTTCCPPTTVLTSQCHLEVGDDLGKRVDNNPVSEQQKHGIIHNPQHLLLLPSYLTKEQQELRTREHRR
jgi:hypothetical protein